jgi:signal transduction histidine kinase
LYNPIVAKQISAIYLDFYYGNMMALMPEFLQSIIVPRHDNNERDKYLAETCYDALSSSQKEFKQENDFYRKAVRMRKHALTQSLTSIEAMFYALNAYRIKQNGELHDEDNISRSQRKTVREAFEFISQGLKDMLPALDHIASVEYSFGKSEWIDPEKFIEAYVKKNEKGWLNFKSVITWEHGHNQAVEDLKDPSTGEIILRKGDSLNLFLFPKDALERVFKNIISNAKAHGFVDKSRNDYQLRFSWHVDGMALIVEIDNNGSAIPNDRDTASLLEYGVSTNLHNDGHNGIGCNEIDDIMQRYDGKVEIVSLPENEFPVKYILTFNRSNTVRSFKL